MQSDVASRVKCARLCRLDRRKISYKVQYLTLMLECVSLRAERTAGCARSSVLVCLGFVWLSFTAVYQFGEKQFLLGGAAVSQVPSILSSFPFSFF